MSSKQEQTAILVAGIAATVQLFRVAADLIVTASAKDAADATKSIDESDDSENKEEGVSYSRRRRESMHRSFASSFRSLSVRRSTSKFFRRSTVTTTTAASVNSINNGINDETADTEKSAIDNATEQEHHPYEEEEEEEEEELTPQTQKYMIYASSVVTFALFCYFLIFCVLLATDDRSSSSSSTVYYYGAGPMGCCTGFFALELWLQFRDFFRRRFSKFQRVMAVMAALLLALGIIFCVSLSSSSSSATTSLATIDILSTAFLIAYSLLVTWQVKVIAAAKAAKDANSADKKARLDMKSILLVLKPYIWPEETATSATLNRFRAMLTWVFVIASKATGLLAPIYLGRASTALAAQDYGLCIRNVVAFCALQFAAAVFKEAQSLVYLRVAQAAFVQLAELAFSHLHNLSLDWHLQKKLGEVIRSMDRGILACDTLMKYLFLWLIPAIAECILVAVIFATYFNDFALAVTVFFFVFAYMVLTVLLTLWRKKFRKQVAKSDNDWHDIATDSLVNFETVKYFTAEEYEMKRFGSAVETFQRGSVNVAASLSTLNICQRLLLQACLATSLSLSALSIRDRSNCCAANGCDTADNITNCCSALGEGVCPGMEIGDFVAVLSYTITLFTPLNFLGSVYNAIVMAIVDLTNLSELLAENPDVCNAKDALDMPKYNESDPDTVVEFQDVKFHYPSQPETNGLKGVSFKMKKGTTTAVVGSTGAGKTTISRLLFRFYDVTGGAVIVNGVDVRMVKQKELREMIGVVPQVATLFNDTLGHNIKYGRKDATDEELEEAAAAAQLTSFVESLPKGYDTMVGDRGLKLSGGEKQRTAIARCILKNPPICIFDEATSALDTITEQSVKEALDRLGNDRTVLVIAHRLGTIKNADNIIVLRDGRINEQGTHEELLSMGGQYAEMWNMQLSSTNTSQSSLGLEQE